MLQGLDDKKNYIIRKESYSLIHMTVIKTFYIFGKFPYRFSVDKYMVRICSDIYFFLRNRRLINVGLWQKKKNFVTESNDKKLSQIIIKL